MSGPISQHIQEDIDVIGKLDELPGDQISMSAKFLAISTSGSSENVLRALRCAKRVGIKTVALLGKDGGQAKALTDMAIVIPSDSTARVQEAHILISHMLCELIEQELGLA